MSACQIMTLFLENPNGFRVRGLQRDNLSNPGFVETATIEVRVQTLQGIDIPLNFSTWPLILPNIPGGSGDYEGFLAAGDMVLDQMQDYYVVFEFSDASFGNSGPVRYLANVERTCLF